MEGHSSLVDENPSHRREDEKERQQVLNFFDLFSLCDDRASYNFLLRCPRRAVGPRKDRRDGGPRQGFLIY